MSDGRSGIERALQLIDGGRGFVGSLVIGAVGVAAIRAGGVVGWAFGAVLIAMCVAGIGFILRGRY